MSKTYAIVTTSIPACFSDRAIVRLENVRTHVVSVSEYRSYRSVFSERHQRVDLSGFCVQSRGLRAPRYRAPDAEHPLGARFYSSAVDTAPGSEGYQALRDRDCRTLDAARTDPALLGLIERSLGLLKSGEAVRPWSPPPIFVTSRGEPDKNVGWLERQVMGVLQGTHVAPFQRAMFGGTVTKVTDTELHVDTGGGEDGEMVQDLPDDRFKWIVGEGEKVLEGMAVSAVKDRLTGAGNPAQARAQAPELFGLVRDAIFDDCRRVGPDGRPRYLAESISFPIKEEFDLVVEAAQWANKTFAVESPTQLQRHPRPESQIDGSLGLTYNFLKIPSIFVGYGERQSA